MTTIKAKLGIQELDIQVNDSGMLKSCLTPHARETLEKLLTSFTATSRAKFASLDIDGDVISVGVEPAVDAFIRQDLRGEFSEAVVKTANSLVRDHMDQASAIDYSALPAPAGGKGRTASEPRTNAAYDHTVIPNF